MAVLFAVSLSLTILCFLVLVVLALTGVRDDTSANIAVVCMVLGALSGASAIGLIGYALFQRLAGA